MLHAASLTAAETWKQPEGPPGKEWVKKTWCVHHDGVGIHSATRKNILLFATMGMDLQGIKLREISQTEKDKYACCHLHVEPKEAELTETESGAMVTRGWGLGRVADLVRVHVCGPEMSEFWGSSVQCGDYG